MQNETHNSPDQSRPTRHRHIFDRRTKGARRFAELVDSFVAEMGGAERVTPAQRVLIDQAATVALDLERLRAAVIHGDPVDPAGLVRLSETADQLMRRLGIGARAA